MATKKYEIVEVTSKNLDDEGLFCVKSKPKGEGYLKKMDWIKKRLKEGMKYKMSLIKDHKNEWTSRGFIEYIPGEKCWRGIEAKGFMVIHCLWVVGQAKNNGIGEALVNEALKDAKGMKGVVTVTSKGGWIVDRKIFDKMKFEEVDSLDVERGFQLMAKVAKGKDVPKFTAAAKKMEPKNKKGLVVYFSEQCPYIADWKKLYQEFAKKKKLGYKEILVKSAAEVRRNPSPYGVFGVFLNGEYVTHEQWMSSRIEKEMVKMLKK